MLPLLALLGAGALLALAGGPSKKATPPRLKPIGVGKVRPPANRVTAALMRIRMGTSPASLPTAQQLLAEVEAQQAKDFGELLKSRPDPHADPATISAWANGHKVNASEMVRLFPEWGWYRNRPVPNPLNPSQMLDPHPETLFRAQYKLDGDRGAVEWWANKGGDFGYHHVWGGFDLWKTIDQLAKDVSDAASWVETHLSHIDWNAVANYIEAAASVVPVLGTAVADIVATAQVIAEELGGGTPLEKAVRAAYDYALASIPGGAELHDTLDPIVDAIIDIAGKGVRPGKEVISKLAERAPDSPSIEGISPRSIVASLLTIVAHALGVAT